MLAQVDRAALLVVARTRELRARNAAREAERALAVRGARLDAAERSAAAAGEAARRNSSSMLRWARVCRGMMLAAFRARAQVGCDAIEWLVARCVTERGVSRSGTWVYSLLRWCSEPAALWRMR